jgi:hypothetical protein
MQISIKTNFPEVRAAMQKAAKQVPYAMQQALNKTAAKAVDAVRKEMPKVFDRPTPWVTNSLRIKYATKSNLQAELGYKDRNSAESSRTMIEPHVYSGKRHFKAMEARLMKIGLIPAGWNAVPGGGARLDANGNMSRGQISQLLNVLGAYTEAGYNKANDKTSERLAKGRAKKNIYGFVYWVNKVGSTKARHLPPGVYQRVTTAFGSSLKPVLVFVKQASYRQRLDFFGVAQAVIDKEFPGEFNRAFEAAMATALPKSSGNRD